MGGGIKATGNTDLEVRAPEHVPAGEPGFKLSRVPGGG